MAEMSMEEMRAALQEARDKLLEQDEVLKLLTEPPLSYGSVCRIMEDEGRTIVSTSAGLVELALPIAKHRKGIEAGACVRLSGKTGQIVGVLKLDGAVGPTARVTKMVGSLFCEVEVAGQGPRIMYAAPQLKVEEGDVVIPDPAGAAVSHNLGKPEAKAPPREALVSWGDVGGLTEAKAALQEAVEMPFKHPDLYARYGRKPTRGVLLYGPPGCGKTMLGKAAASALAKAHGKEEAQGFIYVKGPEVLSKWVGEAEANVRALFTMAREHKAQHGYPAVIFIDEADAILGRRGSRVSSDMEKTVVPAFLAEMDGIGESAATVLLATNRQDTLDPAVVRDGRVDTKVRVSRPDQENAAKIFALHLRERPCGDGLAEYAAEQLFSPDLAMFRVYPKPGGDKNVVLDFTLSDLGSGALCAGIIDKAATLAIRREVQTGKRTQITRADVAEAVKRTHQENMDLDHSEAILLAAEEQGVQVARVAKIVPQEGARAAG